MADYNPGFLTEFNEKIYKTYNQGKADGTINESVPFTAYVEHILHLFDDSGSNLPYRWLNDRNTALKLLKRYEKENSGESFPEWENARLEKEYRDYIQNPPEFKGDYADDAGWVDHIKMYPPIPPFDFWRDNISDKFPENFNPNPYFVDKTRIKKRMSTPFSFSETDKVPLVLPPPSPILSFDNFPPQQVFEDHPGDIISPLWSQQVNQLTSGRKPWRKMKPSRKGGRPARNNGRKISKGIRKHKDKKSRKHTRKKLS